MFTTFEPQARAAPYTVAAETRIGHVHLKVAELERSLEFWRDLIGLEVQQRIGDQAVFLSAGGYHHHLGTNTWSHGPAAASDQARLLSWDLIVPRPEDAEVAARSLVSRGYGTREDSGAFIAADPWGTALRITAGAHS